MKKVGFSLIFVLVLATIAAPAWAAPSVNTVAASPTQIPTGQKTAVKVTARISDPQLLMTANLYRVNADGTSTWLGFLNDFGADGDFKPKDGVFTDAHSFTEPTATTINLRVVVFFLLPDKKIHRSESAIVQVQAGGVLPPNTGGTITGDGGVKLDVPNNALPYPAFVSVAAVPKSTIKAPADPKLPLVGAVKLVIEGVDDVPEPKVPLTLRFPLPAGSTPKSRYLVAKQIVFESVSVVNGQIVIAPPKPLLVPVAEATIVAGNIVTQFGSNPLRGIQTSGDYAVVEAPGSGFVTGIVREANLARGGVVVSNSSNSLITLTASNGSYALFISGMGQFSLFAFHPLRGSTDVDTVDIVVEGATVTKDLDLVSLSPPVNDRPGIRNGGFERRDANGGCELSSWAFTGTAEAVTALGPTTAIAAGNREGPGGLETFPVPAHPGGVTLLPSEGTCMAMIDTGSTPGAISSTMKQVFKVPAGATTLSVDYNYVSEELPEWVNSQFQDTFRAIITPASTGVPVEIANVSVDGAAALGFTLIGDCGFTGGDDTCAHTGWRTATIPIPPGLANTTVTVELLFSVTDLGDNRWDTRILVDNIRFSTAWVDVKTLSTNLSPANGTFPSVQARVEHDLRHANEILSQAGMNLRLRSVTPVANPALADVSQLNPHTTNAGPCSVVNGVDGAPLANFHMEPEEVALMNLQRSAGATTDVNVYYVANSSVGARGWTANPGDFCQEVSITGNQNWGILVSDAAFTSTLAHELGHSLITAASGSGLLHGCTDAAGSCFTMSGAPDTAIVTPGQSLAINGTTIKSP